MRKKQSLNRIVKEYKDATRGAFTGYKLSYHLLTLI